MKQLHGLILRKRIQRNDMEKIFLHQLLQCLHNLHVIVLVISTHQQDPLRAESQKDSVQ